MEKTIVEIKAVETYPAKRHHPEQLHLRIGFEVGYKRAVNDVLAWLKEHLRDYSGFDSQWNANHQIFTDLENEML